MTVRMARANWSCAATYEVAHGGHSAVGNYRNIQADRTERAGVAASGGTNLRVGGKAHRLGKLEQFAGLDLVELVIAAQQQRDYGAITALQQQGLDGFVGGDFEKFAHFLDAVLARRGNFLHRFGWSWARSREGHGLGQFDVGGIVGTGAEGDGVLAGIGEVVKFMRAGAANCAGIRRHGAEL